MLYLLLWSWCLVQAFDCIYRTTISLWCPNRIIGLPIRAQTSEAMLWHVLSYLLSIIPLECCAEFTTDPSFGLVCIFWVAKILLISFGLHSLLWIYRGRCDELLRMPANARCVGRCRIARRFRPQPYGLNWTGVILLCHIATAEFVHIGANLSGPTFGPEAVHQDPEFSWSCGTQQSTTGNIYGICQPEDYAAPSILALQSELELQEPGSCSEDDWTDYAAAPQQRRANSALDGLASFVPHFEEHRLYSGEHPNFVGIALMQQDLVVHRDYLHDYAFSGVDTFLTPVRESRVILRSYFHAWHDRDRALRNYKQQILIRSQPCEEQVFEIWAEHLRRADMCIVPIRPLPNLGLGQVPVVLVVDHDEHVLPLLFDYTSDARVFTASAWSDCSDGFPEVRDLFDLLVPENLCRTDTECMIRANGRQYLPGRAVPLYEGIFIFLIEENLDDTDTQQSVSTMFDSATQSSSLARASSDASVMQQGAPSVATIEAGIVDGDYYYFDVDDQEQLIIIGATIDQETIYRIFQNIATVSTHFEQVDNMLFEARTYFEALQRRLKLVLVVVVVVEWYDGGQFQLDDDVISEWRWIANEIRWVLFDHFPPHLMCILTYGQSYQTCRPQSKKETMTIMYWWTMIAQLRCGLRLLSFRIQKNQTLKGWLSDCSPR